MRPRLSLPTVFGWLSLLVVLLVPSLARAQNMLITWDGANPVRKADLKAHPAQPYWISRAECLADDTFTFTITINGSGDIGTLEVWASITGADCSAQGERTSSVTNPVPCYPVFYSVPQNVGTYQVEIRVQDIVDTERVSAASSVRHGDASNCEPITTSGAAVGVKLYFLLIQSTSANNFVGAAPKYETKYDLSGPPPPAGVSAGIGENSLFVHWTASGNADLVGYSLYCAPAVPAPAGTAGAAGTSATASGGDPGTGGEAGVGGTESVGGSADTGGTTGVGGGTGGQRAINPNCYSPDLVPGEVPPSKLVPCGTGNGSTQSEGQAKGLQNDQPYAVAVAGYDLVGNVGPLSDLACATPQLVDDFFDRYREAGGKAGGGFCSIQRYGSPWSVLLLVGAGLGCALRRRRPGR